MPAGVARARRPSWRWAPSRPTISTCASLDCRCRVIVAACGRSPPRAVGIVFGLPSLRLRGFYLAVSTLAAQFFVQWALTKFGWFSNNNASGVIDAPPLVDRSASASTARSAAIFSRSPSWSSLRLCRLAAGQLPDRAQLHRRSATTKRRRASSACRCCRPSCSPSRSRPSSSAWPACSGPLPI